MHLIKKTVLLIALLQTSACVGTLIDVTTDVAIGVAKVPFKVAGAAIDLAMPDDDKQDDKAKRD